MSNMFQQPSVSALTNDNIIKNSSILNCRTQSNFDNRHAIVLATNPGPYLQKAIKKWFGIMKPKPFCRFIGKSTMLEHAWKRATHCVDARRVVTVSTKSLEPYFLNYSRVSIPGKVLFQPTEAGSAPAIFLALAHILARSPNSTVVIMPSDHFISPESLLSDKIDIACRAVEQDESHAILLTATPKSPSHEQCWIDAPLTNDLPFDPDCLAPVEHIHNQVSLAKANHLYRLGTNWYTGILVVKAKLLWQLGRMHQPDLISRMNDVQQVIRNVSEMYDAEEFISLTTTQAYKKLSNIDFFRQLLLHSLENCIQLHLNGVDWDDWERPDRIQKTIERYGYKAQFVNTRASNLNLTKQLVNI